MPGPRADSFTVLEGYLGWAPVGAAVGDNICLFKGANVPYVLRLMGEEFALIGEAYLHGLIKGEALDKENLEWTDFKIVRNPSNYVVLMSVELK
jgi:hypothetical protein